MNFYEYQEAARRTQNEKLEPAVKLQHAMFGLTSEVGEIASMMQHAIQDGQPIDKKKLADEVGDVLWFLVELLDVYGLELEYAADRNVDKLMKRYPEGFDAVRSKNRHQFGED